MHIHKYTHAHKNATSDDSMSKFYQTLKEQIFSILFKLFHKTEKEEMPLIHFMKVAYS